MRSALLRRLHSRYGRGRYRFVNQTIRVASYSAGADSRGTKLPPSSVPRKKNKKNLKSQASRQNTKDRKVLVERIKNKCPASLNLLGEMAVLETVYPSYINQNSFIDGLNNARYFFEQVSLIEDTVSGDKDDKTIETMVGKVAGLSSAMDNSGPDKSDKDDENNGNIPMRTRHYRNSRYMLGVLDLVEGIAIVHDNINDVPRLNVNPKLMKRSLKYFEEAASLKQGDALLLLSYFYQKGFLPFKIEPDVDKTIEYLADAMMGGHAGALLYAAQRSRFGDSPEIANQNIQDAIEYIQSTLNYGWEDGWAMFLIGDDFGSVHTKSSFRSRPSRKASKVYPNVALTWYLRCTQMEDTHILGATKDEAMLHSQTFMLNNTESDVTMGNPAVPEATAENDVVEKARLYLFDENEFRYKDDDLVVNPGIRRAITNVNIHEPSPPLLYGCGRPFLGQLVAGDALGKAKAMMRAGVHLYNGFGVTKDENKAQDLWQRSLALNPWNASTTEAIRNATNDKQVRSSMTIRMSQLGKGSWEMPFPPHWYFEERGTPTVLNDDHEFELFKSLTKHTIADETLQDKTGNGVEGKPKVGFVLVSTGWATMAWIEEHATSNRKAAYQLRRRFERYVDRQPPTKQDHECLFAAVDLKCYPEFLKADGFVINQCPTIICLYDGEIHSEYGGLPDMKFDHLVTHMMRWAPRFCDLNELVRRPPDL